MEVKDFSFDLKAEADARTIEGLGSVFGNVDSHDDIVMPGAFAKSLQSSLPVMLWQHKQDHVPGVWFSAEENAQGLHLKGTLLDTQLGNETYTLAKAGAIKGLSIGYSVKSATHDRKSGIRHIKEVKLHEVSLVTFPSNERSTITNVKSRPDNERELEEYLREVGYSLGEAKGIIAKGYKAIAGQREVDGTELDKLANLLRKYNIGS